MDYVVDLQSIDMLFERFEKQNIRFINADDIQI